MSENIGRRNVVAGIAAATAAGAMGVRVGDAHGAASKGAVVRGKRIKHSACRWCFGGIELDELCRRGKEIGLESIELLGPDEWAVARKHGLTCAVASGVNSNPIPKGLNRVEHHDAIVKDLEERLPLVAAAGIPCQIVFSGNRGGQEDAEGIRNCVKGLKRVTGLAEKLGVTIVMELLSSKDHADYQCDRTPLGVAIVEGVGSERFKLLYDIYHMQRMEGDVIDTISKHMGHIAHFHTGGVPGRAEIDESQELNYRTIMRAIADTGYTGFVGQEFIPRKDPLTSLEAAVKLCDV